MDISPVFRPLWSYTKYSHAFKPTDNPKLKTYNPPKFRAIHGFDTETNSEGNVYLISVSYKVNAFQDKEESLFANKTSEILEFLFKHGRHSLNWFYNIQFDFDAIIKQHLKTIPLEKALETAKKDKFHIDVNGKRLTISFIQGKYVKISDGKHQAYFYDCANFYKGRLDDEAKRFLGYGKDIFGVSDSQIDVTKGLDLGRDVVAKRCEIDARLTRDLAELLIQNVKNNFGILPRHWNSKASLSKELLIRTIAEKYIKTFQNCALHREVLEFAYRAYKGGIFCNFVKGLVNDVSEIDLVSAYPSVIKHLPDMVNGKWHKIIDGQMNPKASFGVYRVYRQFDGYSPYFSTGLKQIIYPKTSALYEDFLVKPEIEFLRNRGYLVHVVSGYEFVHTTNLEYPFRALIDNLFALKDRAKKEGNKSTYELAKIISNAIYGVFAETRHGIGILFNPVYASYITAMTRIRITELAEKYFEKVYEIATDAIIGRLRTDIPIPFSSELGGFELKHRLPSDCVIVQAGLTLDKYGNPIRNRGIPLIDRENVKFNKKIEFRDDKLIMNSNRPRHFKESARQGKLEQINQFLPENKVIQINDDKRIWSNRNITEKDLFSGTIMSEPLDEDYLDEYDPEVSFIDSFELENYLASEIKEYEENAYFDEIAIERLPKHAILG